MSIASILNFVLMCVENHNYIQQCFVQINNNFFIKYGRYSLDVQ